MINIKSDGNGLAILERRVSKIQLSDMMNIGLEEVTNSIKSSKNYDGSGMKPLKPETIKIKQKRGSVAPSTPLIFKGGLITGFKQKKISSIEIHGIDVGKSKGYYGGSIKSSDVLKYQKEKGRYIMGWTKTALTRVNKYLQDKISNA